MIALLWLNHFYLQEKRKSPDGRTPDGLSAVQVKRLEDLEYEWKAVILISVDCLGETLEERTQLSNAELDALAPFDYDADDEILDLIAVPVANNEWEVRKALLLGMSS